MQNSRRPVSETFLYFLRGATVWVFIQSRYKCSSDNVTIEPKQLRPGQILYEFNLVDLVRCNDLSLFKKATISDFYFGTVAPGRTYLHCSRKKMRQRRSIRGCYRFFFYATALDQSFLLNFSSLCEFFSFGWSCRHGILWMQIEVTSHFYLNIQSAVHSVSLDLTRSNTPGEGGRWGMALPITAHTGRFLPKRVRF